MPALNRSRSVAAFGDIGRLRRLHSDEQGAAIDPKAVFGCLRKPTFNVWHERPVGGAAGTGPLDRGVGRQFVEAPSNRIELGLRIP